MRSWINIVEAKDPKLRVLNQEAFDDDDVVAYLAAFNEEARNPKSITKFIKVTADIYECRWLPGRNFLFFVRDDKIVAFLEFSKHNSRKGRGFRIDLLGVDPAYRDQGLAIRLCNHCLNMGTVYTTAQTPGGIAMTMSMLKAGQKILAFDKNGKNPDIVITDPAEYSKLIRELPLAYEFANIDERKKSWW